MLDPAIVQEDVVFHIEDIVDAEVGAEIIIDFLMDDEVHAYILSFSSSWLAC